MKYFKFTEPYFDLIKAENEDKALEVYASVVCDPSFDEGYPEKITKAEAVCLLLTAKDEDGKSLTQEEITEIINSDTEEVLLVDGSLC